MAKTAKKSAKKAAKKSAKKSAKKAAKKKKWSDSKNEGSPQAAFVFFKSVWSLLSEYPARYCLFWFFYLLNPLIAIEFLAWAFSKLSTSKKIILLREEHAALRLNSTYSKHRELSHGGEFRVVRGKGERASITRAGPRLWVPADGEGLVIL